MVILRLGRGGGDFRAWLGDNHDASTILLGKFYTHSEGDPHVLLPQVTLIANIKFIASQKEHKGKMPKILYFQEIALWHELYNV
jgi:hypothetical protein